MAYAINKQALIDAFYAGQGVPADNWMPPGTQYYKAESLPTYDPEKAKALIAGVRRDGPDPRVLVPVGRQPAVHAGPEGHLRGHPPRPRGRRLHDRPDRHLETRTTSTLSRRQLPRWLIGWTCDWPGPTTSSARRSSTTAVSRPRTRSSRTRTTSSTRPWSTRSPRPTRRRPAAVGEGAGSHPRRHPHHPARLARRLPRPPRDVKGFVDRRRCLNEYLNWSGSTASPRPRAFARSPGVFGPGRTLRWPRPRPPACPERTPSPRWLKYTIRRLLGAIPVLFGLSIILFAFVHLLPGRSGRRSSASTPRRGVAACVQTWASTSPCGCSTDYLGGLLHGDFGTRIINNKPFLTEFRVRFPATIELAVAAMLFAVGVGIPLGRLAARHAQAGPTARSRSSPSSGSASRCSCWR